MSTDSRQEWSLALHGGAGGDSAQMPIEYRNRKLAGLQAALDKGREMLEARVDAIDVVQSVVEALENDPSFNAGRGSVFNDVGDVSCDASIMDGRDLSCGAVANCMKARNPIRLARGVRDLTPHALLVGPSADEFAAEIGLPLEDQDYFKTDEQRAKWEEWKLRSALKKNEPSTSSRPPEEGGKDRLFHLSTVGCVARDVNGNLASATSTGGLLGKRFGRVGDSPIIGAGTYAKNGVCAVSCTGVGELFIKHCVASSISARIELLDESLEQAGRHVVSHTLPTDSGGVIAIGARGDIIIQYNTPMMARGLATSKGLFQVALDEGAAIRAG